MKRIGLYGGSFDPVHVGHLLVARAALDELGLDRLFFIPAARSPFKPDSEPLDGQWRARLLRMALAGCPKYAVWPLELERGGLSFTIDTAKEFSERFPGAALFYLIGTDHVASLPKWKEADQLRELVQFAVIPRPGETPKPAPAGFHCQGLKGVPIELSSSAVRERIRQGLSYDELLPRGLPEVVRRYRLYSST